MSFKEVEDKGDPLLSLDEGWKKWLSSSKPAEYSSVEVKAEFKLEEEAKECENPDVIHLSKKDASASTDIVDEVITDAEYHTVYIKNYISNYNKEDMMNINTIFKESVLQYEKKQFHQEILNKVVETSNEVKSEKLEKLYIQYLRHAADLEILSCLKCQYQTMHKSNLKTHLLLIHQKELESKMFQCLLCSYKVRNLVYLKKHQLMHCTDNDSGPRVVDKVKKCDFCSFTTENDKIFQKHKCSEDLKKFVQKRSKNSDNQKWLKCPKCDYMTMRKKSLKSHLECHKDPEKQQCNYMCEICSRRLRTKAGLEFHILRHKPINEVEEIFKCLQCKYQTKFKSNLKIHMEVHQAPSFVCDVCGFQTRRKWNHEMHLLTHKNENEVPVYKCALCFYKTKFKDRLKKHLARGTHLGAAKMVRKQARHTISNNSNIKVNKKVLKCSACEFETSSRKDYCKHVVKHRAKGEPVEKTYSCELCSFKTFYSSSFSTHLKSHKSLEEVETFQCPKCTFRTRLKGNLKKHINIHKDPSELQTFKCDICGIQLTRKENLTVHMLLHRSPEETEILKCSICSYQSKIRAYMQVHLKKTHKIVTRRNEYRNYCTIINCKGEKMSLVRLARYVSSSNLE